MLRLATSVLLMVCLSLPAGEAEPAVEGAKLLVGNEIAVDAHSEKVRLKLARFGADEDGCLSVALCPVRLAGGDRCFEVCVAVYDEDGLLVGAGRQQYAFRIPYLAGLVPNLFCPKELDQIPLGLTAAQRGVKAVVTVFDLAETTQQPRPN